jgi:hypothetical protein
MATHDILLPISIDDGLKMDAAEAKALGSMLAEDYRSAEPFPHIVLDNFLPDALVRRMVEHFPQEALQSDRVFDINYGGHHKRQILPDDCDPAVREFFSFFNSRPVLQFLEGLTGIEALIPDPYFEGGGFHEISTGGKLGVHADFRIHGALHLERRLNLLIYLNEDWRDEWGGKLELWDRKMTRCEKRIEPYLNRCVVFSTDADSYHGHPDPLQTPEGVKRRSIALYYYTASRAIYKEVPNLSTMYRARPGDPKSVRREALRFRVDQYLDDWLPPVLARLVHKVRYRLGWT